MSVISQKCPSCGAILEFDSQTQKWPCEYCKREFTIEELPIEKIEVKQELESYHCSNCGADIIHDIVEVQLLLAIE